MKSEEVNASLPSRYHCGKVLIEDDGKNGRGKGGVGEIIHRPTENLSLLNGHAKLMNDGGTRGLGDGVNVLSLRVSLSPHLPILSFECLTQIDLISCLIKT